MVSGFSSCAFPLAGPDDDASKPRNVYRIMARGVQKTGELDFMVARRSPVRSLVPPFCRTQADGLVRIVTTVDDAKRTYLPSSRKVVRPLHTWHQ